MSGWFCSERVRPRSVESRWRMERLERVGREGHQEEEERGDDEHRQHGPSHERVRQPSAELGHDHRGVTRQDQRPQDDRTLERGPQRGHVVERGRAAAAVVGHELHGEVAGDERTLHGEDRQDRTEHDQRGVGNSEPLQIGALLDERVDERERTEHGSGQAEQHARRAEEDVHGAVVAGTEPPCSASLMRSWFTAS